MNTSEIVQATQDQTHVKLLAVFSFVVAGFSGLGLIFVGVHYMIMSTVFNSPKVWEQMQAQAAAQHQPGPPFNPQQFLHIFIWMYLFFGLWSLISLVANLAAGFGLLGFRARTFALVVGVLNCLNVPFGTVLGVFTIVVLMRDSVRARFAIGPALASAMPTG
jgi:hypothetical protein